LHAGSPSSSEEWLKRLNADKATERQGGEAPDTESYKYMSAINTAVVEEQHLPHELQIARRSIGTAKAENSSILTNPRLPSVERSRLRQVRGQVSQMIRRQRH